MKKYKTAAVTVMLLLLLTAGMKYVSAGPMETEEAPGPEVIALMSGVQDEDGMFYYREENCGIVLQVMNSVPEGSEAEFTTEVKIDDTVCEVQQEMTDGLLVMTVAPETVQSCGDGKHRLSVCVSDAEGNRTESIKEEGSSGVVIKEGSAEFVLDTAAPVCRLTIVPENPARKELCAQGERYYYNCAFTAEAVVRDDNPDPERIFVMRGEETGEAYRSETVQILDFPSRVREMLSPGGDNGTEEEEAAKGGKTVRFTDAVTADGVYRYEICGADKAGNALVTEETPAMEKEGNRSRHIVIDTEAPQGLLSVSSGGKRVYEMTADGSVRRAEPFLRSREAEITLSADYRTERSPVRLAFTVEADPEKNSGKEDSGSFAYDAVLKRKQDGRQEFYITEFSLTDLSGNRTEGFVPHGIRLDADPPEVDGLSPVIDLSASGGEEGAGFPSGETADGYPLFSSDVTLAVTVSDPYPGEGSSGLVRISYELFRGESAAAEGVLWEDSVQGGAENDSPVYEVSRQLLIPADEYEENHMKVIIRAQDHAGNTVSRSYGFGIDATPPGIVVSVSGGTARNGMYFSEPRRAVITVSDANFVPERILTEVKQTGKGILSLPYQTEILFEQDGEYELSVSGTDAAGNKAVSVKYEGEAAEHFVVDRTPPELAVSYDRNDAENNMYFRNPRTAELSVRDAFFGGENRLFILDGTNGEESDPGVVFEPVRTADGQDPAGSERSKAKIRFSEDGMYALGGTVTDLAGNESKPLQEGFFVIDQTPPVIILEGVREWSANREPVSIAVKMEDANPDPERLSAILEALHAGETKHFRNGSADPESEEASGQGGSAVLALPVVDEDDLYHLTAAAADLAGNEAVAELTFSENQGGTVFLFEQQEVLGRYVREGFQPSFILYNVDEITVLSVTVNGAEVPYLFEGNRLLLKDPLTEDGKYGIVIDTKDAAGNINSMEPAEFFIDTSPPVIRVGGLKEGVTEYTEEFEITLRTEREEDFFRYVKLDGSTVFQEGESGELSLKISQYGEHTLEMQAEDPAGNRSEAEKYTFVLRADVKERWLGDKPDSRLLYIVTFMIPGAAVFPILRRVRRKKYI